MESVPEIEHKSQTINVVPLFHPEHFHQPKYEKKSLERPSRNYQKTPSEINHGK